MKCDPDQVVLLNNSERGAEDYAEWLSIPPERVRVVRNGVYLSEESRPASACRAELKKALGIPAAAQLIGGMFRFSEEKQPLLWLRVAAKVIETLPNAYFAIFGRGQMESETKDLAEEMGISARVRFCGHVKPSTHGLAPCDLILLTSRGEGTPNVLIEAQWLGLPVVTTDAGGAREAVSHGVTGVVVHSDDATSLADAVVGCLRDASFGEQASREGPAFVERKYGVDRMIKETLEVYDFGKRRR
jgi:glycosyltransferase involved in cell wall biosynthesis